MKDPYEILGVQRSADEAAIRAAYRKLAKRHHPDLNPGKPEAAERFKEISAAYELLSDAEKRGKFDRGEIDAEGNEIHPERHFYRDFREGPGAERYHASSSGFTQDDIDAFFSQAFGGTGAGSGGFTAGYAGGAGAGGRGGGPRFTARGPDAHYMLTVGFLDAVNGTTRRITLPEGRTLDVRIPAGTEDGHVLRLKGQGMPGYNGGPAGDALVEIAVAPHPLFKRQGDDIVIELPVTLQEAVVGTSLEVPTIRGKVRLTIPPGSGSGTRLRLRGRGIREGHQYVQLHVVVPPADEPELAEFLRHWKPKHAFNPRAGLEDA
jgi:DnaJ-class molecular chaperone